MDYIYKASNRGATQVQPKNGKTYTLEELQNIVGGFIQIIQLDNNEVAVIDEEGKIKGKFMNVLANHYCRLHGGNAMPNDFIVGDVLICNENSIE